MAARAKIEESARPKEYLDIPEAVRENVLYPMLRAQDLFTTATLSKKEGELSKKVLEDSRLEALQTKRQQLEDLIEERDKSRIFSFHRNFPMIRSFPPDMDVVNDQLGRIDAQIKQLKAIPVPFFPQRTYGMDYHSILDSDGVPLTEPPKKRGGRSYRELERMGSMRGGQDVQQYFKDKSYWAYPRQFPRDLQGGGVCIAGFCDDEDIVEEELAQAPRPPPPRSLPPPPPASGRLENMLERANLLSDSVLSNLVFDEARAVSGADRDSMGAVRNPSRPYASYETRVVYKITPRNVERIIYDASGQEVRSRRRYTFRSQDFLDSNNRITNERDLQMIPQDERDTFWEAMMEANRGRTGTIELTPYDEDDEEEKED